MHNWKGSLIPFYRVRPVILAKVLEPDIESESKTAQTTTRQEHARVPLLPTNPEK
jgi:hypothetical protein